MCSLKKCWFFFAVVWIFGIMLGYFWGWSVMRKYEASEQTCHEYYFKNPAISSSLYSSVREDILTSLNLKKGEVAYFYSEDSKVYKIRRIK